MKKQRLSIAPTNAAFDKLPAKALEKLLDPNNKDLLESLLKYHVVSGKVLAAQVVTLSSATTVEGSDVKIVANKGGVKVNNAKVTATDLEVDNGVIHVIDTVIMPKGFLGELNSR